MSKLYTGGPYKQRDGSAITETSTNVNTGGIKMPGTSDLVRTVGFGVGDNENTRVVGGVACGQAEWGSLLSTTGVSGVATGITNGAGNYVGLANMTKLSHGLSVGDIVNISNNAVSANDTGLYMGPKRVVAVVNVDNVILNTEYVRDQTGISYSAPVGSVAHQDENNYSIRTVAGTVHGQANTKITSPASDYGRNKVHKVNAVRTRKVGTAIRTGDWVPFSGEFINQPSQSNDITGYGTDEVTQGTSTYGLKGEFAYRFGGASPATGDYTAKNG